jgi:glutamate synthase domain-containing protein 2
MSPWRMMNEWGIPTVYLECLLYDYLSRLDRKGAFIPSCAIAGGIALEDQIFKAIALGAPYFKAVCLGRSTLTAATVGKSNAEKLRREHDEEESYQRALMQTFVNMTQIRAKYGKRFNEILPSAVGMYNYYERLTTGLQQLMAGARKYRLDLIERGDLMALSTEAATVSGILYIMDCDREEVDSILS